jgi:hypothetical protein
MLLSTCSPSKTCLRLPGERCELLFGIAPPTLQPQDEIDENAVLKDVQLPDRGVVDLQQSFELLAAEH